jgi:plastocyanin
MRSQRVALAVGALVLGVGAGAIPAAAVVGKQPSKAKPKTITVADNYFSLAKLTVKKGQTIKWSWDRNNEDSHNVTLLSGPKGVNKLQFSSATGATGIRFQRTFLKPGKYHFQCVIHPFSMNTIVTVTK